MAYKLKKEWEGKSIDSLNIPLDELTQAQILKLNESVRAEKIIEVLESRIEILSGKIETPDSDSTLIN